jgi:hypothetical protein
MITLDQDITIGCAFRYALGRRTYVIDSVASEIERQVDEISTKTLARFVREIGDAIDNKSAGMDMDERRWLECRAIIIVELKRRGIDIDY